MVQLLTIKYTKEEERLLLISNLSSVFIGIPIGLLLGYWIGFFANVELAASSSVGWTIFWLKADLTLAPITWITSFTTCFLVHNKTKAAGPMQVGRMFPGTLIFPLTMAYSFLVMALAILPLCSLLQRYINFLLTEFVGALVFLPFVILVGAVLLPETRAGKGLRRFRHSTRRPKKKATEERNT
jgi:hypothetical protein